MRVALHCGQNFVLHKLRVAARHGVIFEAPLASLCVAPSVADGNCNNRRQLAFRNQGIERGEEHAVGAVRANDERRYTARHVGLWHVDGDLADVR